MNRVGTGWDIHRLAEGRTLILGGVEIPSCKGCLGHSDGDALIHAIIDAMFGAAGLGDIGTHFSDEDPLYKDISSVVLLRTAHDLVREKGLRLVNVDTTVILQTPKLSPYADSIKESLAQALDLDVEYIGVKAKTAEKMLNELGSGDAVCAMASVLLSD